MTTDISATLIDVIEAFADAEGRDHLIDVLALRALVGGDAMTRPTVAPTAARATAARGAWARWIPLAAGIAIIGGITGYVAGARTNGMSVAAETTVTAPPP